MANPRRDDRDRDPKAGGNHAAKGGSWRDRFPGWETFQGRVHDPRAERNIDPTKDVRYDTNLKPSSIVHKQGLVFWVLLATIGIVLLVLAGYAMYYKFQVPSRRSPDVPRASLHMQTSGPADRVVDRVLPLRADRHEHAELPVPVKLVKN